MSEQWAVKYRPARWFDFAGQRPAIWTLFQTILRDDPPPAILLYGEAGCGKTSTARTIAKSLNCESEVRSAREWPCGKCSSCLAIASGSSVDVEEIDAASNGSVATIRELRQRAGQYTTSRYKVFIIDESLALDTPLPTPEGWTTAEKVQPGDYLLGKNGQPTRVIRKTPVFVDKDCFRVTFRDGTSVVASGNHKWLVRCSYGKNGRNRTLRGIPRVRTTAELAAFVQRGSRAAVPRSGSWQLPAAELPVHPYVLGLWLGDGSTGQPHISGLAEDLKFYQSRLQELGIESTFQPTAAGKADRLGLSSVHGRRGAKGSPTAQGLRALPCYLLKHIPPEYLRGSIAQREELLRGLMDTDGWVGQDGSCAYSGNDELTTGVLELLRGLGQTARRYWKPDIRSPRGGCYQVWFKPHGGLVPVCLPRKVSRVSQAVTDVSWVGIRSIEPVSSVPVQCLEVDAEDHLFQVGEGCVVTHNCHQMSPEAFDALLKTLEEPLEGVVFILVTTRLRKIPRTIQTRCGKFRFDPLSVPVIRQRLQYIAAAEGFSPGPGLLTAIAEAAEGGLRDAIMAMDLAASAGITSVTMWRELTGVTDFAPVLLAAAAAADYGTMFAALDEAVAGDPGRVTSQLTLCMTDMLVLTVPGGEISRDGEAAESRRVLAARLGPGRILAGLQVLWELPKVATGNPRADLSLACSMISRRWAPPAAPASPIAPGESGQDALSRLRGVLGAPSDQPGVA